VTNRTAAHSSGKLSICKAFIVTFNLLVAAWLPIRRADGTRENIAPAAITDRIETNPVVALDWPRADFRLAGLEFLIGLLATSFPPRDQAAWLDHWRDPPPPGTLATAFAPFRQAFDLDGPGPRFMQDLEDLPGEPDTPETLLIEAPGEAALRKNTTLLVKRGRVTVLSRAAAAIALYTLQTYAPAGGRGNLTSLRGGGPLTTLIVPGSQRGDGEVPLWHLVWANVPCGAAPATAELPIVFPWLAPTRTSENSRKTSPADAHPLQAFWGMPRRIRLDFADATAGTRCDLSGETDQIVVTGWRQRPNGVRYEAWTHPLSPYYADKKSGGWLPQHPQPGGIGYRHWVGLLFQLPRANTRPAETVSVWLRDRRRDAAEAAGQSDLDARILAGGYDMDNMKARAFVESEMPVIVARDPDAQAAEAAFAFALVTAADEAARALRGALRTALFDRETAFDATPLSAASESFWSRTHDPFFALIREAKAMLDREPDADLVPLRVRWRDALRRTARDLFDIAAPLDPMAASFDPHRIVEARRHLTSAFAGYGASGKAIFDALGLPAPEQRPKGRKSARSKETA
jgi:CRISPR system Cascade subunit CasA